MPKLILILMCLGLAMVAVIGFFSCVRSPRTDFRPKPEEVAWFVAQTSIRFPAGTAYLVYDRSEAFQGSGGMACLKVRIPTAQVPEFLHQPLLAKADRPDFVPGEKPWLPGWAPQLLKNARMLTVPIALGAAPNEQGDLSVTTGDPSAGFVLAYLEYVHR